MVTERRLSVAAGGRSRRRTSESSGDVLTERQSGAVVMERGSGDVVTERHRVT